jgi:hypothetical protein
MCTPVDQGVLVVIGELLVRTLAARGAAISRRKALNVFISVTETALVHDPSCQHDQARPAEQE